MIGQNDVSGSNRGGQRYSMVSEQMGELLSVKNHNIFDRSRPKYLYGRCRGFEVLFYLTQYWNASGMDSEPLEFLDVSRKREEPISLRAFPKYETVKSTHAYTETVFKVTQELTSARIVDQFWPRRIPQS